MSRHRACAGCSTTCEPAYRRRYGRDFWADLEADPHPRATFDTQMATRFRTQAPQIARRYDGSASPGTAAERFATAGLADRRSTVPAPPSRTAPSW